MSLDLELEAQAYLEYLDENEMPYDEQMMYLLLISAVKCFQYYEGEEYTIPQILNKFVGKWESRDAYIEEMLVEHGIEEKIQQINIPCPNGSVAMYIECLDFDQIWNTMSQCGMSMKGFVNVHSENNPDFDHCFYVYDMTK